MDKVKLEEVMQAYNLLMGYSNIKEDISDIRRRNKKPNPILKKLNIDEKKAENFVHYHKWHVIISVITLIVLIFSIKGCVNRVDPDVNLVFIGDFYSSDTDVLKTNIKTQASTIIEPGIDLIALSAQVTGEQDYAMRMKAVAIIAAGDVDVFVTDRVNFKQYAEQGTFLPLEGYTEQFGINIENNKDNFIKSEEDKEAHLYGISINNSKLLKDSKVVYKDGILGLRVNTKNKDKAIELFKLLLNEK